MGFFDFLNFWSLNDIEGEIKKEVEKQATLTSEVVEKLNKIIELLEKKNKEE